MLQRLESIRFLAGRCPGRKAPCRSDRRQTEPRIQPVFLSLGHEPLGLMKQQRTTVIAFVGRAVGWSDGGETALPHRRTGTVTQRQRAPESTRSYH
jgi:hypothetical protein